MPHYEPIAWAKHFVSRYVLAFDYLRCSQTALINGVQMTQDSPVTFVPSFFVEIPSPKFSSPKTIKRLGNLPTSIHGLLKGLRRSLRGRGPGSVWWSESPRGPLEEPLMDVIYVGSRFQNPSALMGPWMDWVREGSRTLFKIKSIMYKLFSVHTLYKDKICALANFGKWNNHIW